MKTYVLEVDGRAAVAFRAKDDTAAEKFGTDVWPAVAATWGHNCEGQKLSFRSATIPEQARWRSASVDDTVEHGNEVDSVDGLLVGLGEEKRGTRRH